MIEDAGGEAAAREAYDWWGGILPFDMVNTNKIEKAVVAYKEHQLTTPTPSMYSLKPDMQQPNTINNASMQGQLESFLKSLPAEGQPNVQTEAVAPQLLDNSQRIFNVTLNVTDERLLIPIIRREFETMMAQDQTAKRYDQFDAIEALA